MLVLIKKNIISPLFPLFTWLVQVGLYLGLDIVSYFTFA